jgi:hypothetical protein
VSTAIAPLHFFGRYALTIVDNGYSIVAVLPGTKQPRFRNWTAACFKDSDSKFVARHAAKFPQDGVGIACGTKVIGIDIDETDAEEAARFHQIALEVLGDTPLVRIGQFPKRLLVYRAREPINTMRCGVEVLGCGSKFVAFGIHRETEKPYYWPEDSPTDTDIGALPVADGNLIEQYLQRVSAKPVTVVAPTNDNATSRPRALPKPELEGLQSRDVRNENGRVMEGREAFLTLLVWEEYRRRYSGVDDLAQRAWNRFAAEADLARPKGNSRRSRYCIRDARAKARAIVRKAPPVKSNVHGFHLVRHLHSFRRRSYWTDERKQRHYGIATARGLAVTRLAVNRAMLDAVLLGAGQCAATVKELAAASGLSVRAVQSARRDLVDEGLWITERGVYVPVAFDTSVAASIPANEGRAAA